VQVFATVWVMTGGGPGYATYVLGLYMYNTAFEYSRFGYANAMSVVVAVLAAVGMATLLRMIQRRLSAF
ncbi:MAG: carbohydrate ABC transporter permease, partial [Acidimicrobiales bacterium]